ncbi:MAG: hypothetical protein WDA06_07335 [Phenylobacterium sp.]
MKIANYSKFNTYSYILSKHIFKLIKTKLINKEEFSFYIFNIEKELSPPNIVNIMNDVKIGSIEVSCDIINKNYDDDNNINFMLNGSVSYYPNDYEKYINIKIKLYNNFSDKNYTQFIFMLKEIIRHELEHTTQNFEEVMQFNNYSRYGDSDNMISSLLNYLLNPIEIKPHVEGLYYRAKKEKKPFKQILDERFNLLENLHKNKKGIDPTLLHEAMEKVKARYLEEARKKFSNWFSKAKNKIEQPTSLLEV